MARLGGFSMRKFIGLCFLTATLVASSARAQGIFIEKGDPSTVSATVGGGVFKDAWGAGLAAGYSYRGVFDVGFDFTRFAYTAGVHNTLAGYSVAPYATWHLFRHDVDELPVSIAATFAMQRIFYAGNGLANPEGWGLVAGGSVYRRLELGTSIVFIPEAFVGFDMAYTRLYTGAGDQNSGNTADQSVNYRTDSKYSFRALFRPNLLIHSSFVLAPYVGYEGALAFSMGANVGAIF
jgi:hypothetical protein